ncbi:MAG: helix-turn-helix domain-containing GNAT family N-acetyltransferase [Hyphomicrobiaceae bacterium]|nr:helix-turn-helix domain-containing GNAT family N-acetyltransferase [Hyphomicrobiaceae bacterium]
MTLHAPDATVATVRRFSRFYTRRIGVLQEALLGTALSLPEGRIVYEIALREGATATEIAADLGLDAGYMSRLLKGLETRGLVSRQPCASDARQSLLALTAKGRREFDRINRRSDRDVGKLLAPLSAADRRLLGASLETAERLLGGGRPAACTLRGLAPGDIGWVVHRHGALYAQEYGLDATFEALVAKVAAEFVERFDPAGERAWIAEVEGRIVGSVFLTRKSQTLAQLRLLYVEPDMRGAGIGRRLVEACLAHARDVGYARMTLWTNDVLTAARNIYRSMGFVMVESKPYHGFGRDMVGETWERDL